MPWPYPAPKPAPERVKLGQLINAALRSVKDVSCDEGDGEVFNHLADAEDALRKALDLAVSAPEAK